MKVEIKTVDYSKEWEARLSELPLIGLTFEIDGYLFKVVKVVKHFDSITIEAGIKKLIESSKPPTIYVENGL